MQHSTLYTLVFAAVVCLICSILVSGSAVALRARQERNAVLDKQRNVLAVAGLLEPGKKKLSADATEQRFDESIRVRLVELRTGQYPTDEEALLADYDAETTPEYGQIYQVVRDGFHHPRTVGHRVGVELGIVRRWKPDLLVGYTWPLTSIVGRLAHIPTVQIIKSVVHPAAPGLLLGFWSSWFQYSGIQIRVPVCCKI